MSEKRVAVIGNLTTITGFRLAGVDLTFLVRDRDQDRGFEETRKAVKEVYQLDDVGILIISARLALGVREDIARESRYKPLFPIIVEVPDSGGMPDGFQDPIKDLIRRTTGIETVK